MKFDSQGFPEAFSAICAGSEIQLGGYIWLSDNLLLFPDALIRIATPPASGLSTSLFFDLDSIASRFSLPCGREDLTTINDCLWTLVTKISTAIDAAASPYLINAGTAVPSFYAYIDEIPFGVEVKAYSSTHRL